MTDDGTATTRAAAAELPRSAPLLVLAEDDDEFRTLLARTLRRAGYNVAELNNGVQLLRALVAGRKGQASEIALVISDIRMPGASGLDALAGIDPASWPIPVVLMTGFGDRETHAAAKKLGAAAVIDKPFDLDELLALVTQLLHRDQAACAK